MDFQIFQLADCGQVSEILKKHKISKHWILYIVTVKIY